VFSKADEMASLINPTHGPETKNKENKKTKGKINIEA